MSDTVLADVPTSETSTNSAPIFKRHENGVHVAVFKNVGDDGKVSYRIRDHYFYKDKEGSFQDTDGGFPEKTLQKIQYLQEALAAIDDDKN